MAQMAKEAKTISSSPSRRMKIGDFLLRRLEEVGVRHLFGVPGDYNLELLQQLQDTGTLKWIGTCSELTRPMSGHLGAIVRRQNRQGPASRT